MKKLTDIELSKIKGGSLLKLYTERFTYMFRYMKISYLVYKNFE